MEPALFLQRLRPILYTGIIFGRLNYEWESKYLLNVVIRRDGSSRFGADHRFGTFWSIGSGWIFSNTDFMKNSMPFLTFGKIRACYGLTGNDQMQDYQYLTLFTTSSGALSYQGSSILSPSRINNPGLHWETNKKMEVGLDLAFIRDRIQLTANYYRNRTGNQLGYLNLAQQSGFNACQSNFDAVIQNTGLEFELNSTNIDRNKFQWKTSINLTIPENADRWLNLKRTNNVDAVLSLIKPQWKPFQKLYPIPLTELKANPNLKDNPGY